MENNKELIDALIENAKLKRLEWQVENILNQLLIEYWERCDTSRCPIIQSPTERMRYGVEPEDAMCSIIELIRLLSVPTDNSAG